MSLHVLVFNKIEGYRKVLFYYFPCKWSFFGFFFCIVWYVIAISSWIFTPNVEKCDFEYLFWDSIWF